MNASTYDPITPALPPASGDWRTPEQRLAAAAIESAITDYVGCAAFECGLRADPPSGLYARGRSGPGMEYRGAYATARAFLFSDDRLYDFAEACACLGLDAQAVRESVRRAVRSLGTSEQRRVGSRKRREPRVVPVRV